MSRRPYDDKGGDDGDGVLQKRDWNIHAHRFRKARAAFMSAQRPGDDADPHRPLLSALPRPSGNANASGPLFGHGGKQPLRRARCWY
jgi:hypothetical protein